MCGIAGIFAYAPTAEAVDEGELLRIRDRMIARGPDGVGAWFTPERRLGLAHLRLSIIDLSDRAAQPMLSDDGQLAITFNGEIYNYRALRAQLEARGHAFHTDSDTEVLLQLYQAKGAAMVSELRGMFALGIWDARRQGLLLARDPYGIKPLYYADDGGVVRFASQVKGLLASGQVSRDPDPAGWVGFHLFGSVPEPFTTYRAIRTLPAGATLWIDQGGSGAPESYFSVAEAYVRAEAQPLHLGRGDQQAYVRAALLDSVRSHMVADVPVGVFLSAGVDSGALLGLMRDAGGEAIEAVTLRYEEFASRAEDEAPLAAACAAHYDSRHTVRMVGEREFASDLPLVFDAMDQPTIDGVNTWFVSKAARELGLKAAISGLGGDELFGGYPSFRTVPSTVRTWAIPSRSGVGEAFRMFAETTGLSSVVNPKAAGLLTYGGTFEGAYFLRRGLFMPWELGRLMDPGVATEGLRILDPLGHIRGALSPAPRSGFAKVAVLEASLYMRNQLLRDTDWASMAHGVEVRPPLVDAQLLEAVAPLGGALAGRAGKALLAASPSRPLPDVIANRPKTGFGTPVAQWLQRHPGLQAWRETPMLARGNCPWARRWAYQLAAA